MVLILIHYLKTIITITYFAAIASTYVFVVINEIFVGINIINAHSEVSTLVSIFFAHHKYL